MRNFFIKISRSFSILYFYCLIIFIYELIVIETTPVDASDRKLIYPSGEIVGIYIECDGIFVIDTCQVETASGVLINPSKDILQTGDYILEVNGEPISQKEELINAISESNGLAVRLKVERGEEVFETSLTPVLARNGEYKLGVWVKDDLAGVGTITYVTSSGDFGALGHGMGDGETGELVEICGGDLYISKIADIVKGEKGDPGQVKGVLYYGDANHLGEVEKNTSIGVYGEIDADNMTNFIIYEKAYEVAYKNEIKIGNAKIISDISGEKKSYDVEITYVDYFALNSNKGLHIRITDKELLELTGGIVQGMSGSPIIQNGRVVGAVTHVLINNPEKGYGIFIEEMLDE